MKKDVIFCFLLTIVGIAGAAPVELTVAGYEGAETLKDFPLPLRLCVATTPSSSQNGGRILLSPTAGAPSLRSSEIRVTDEKGIELSSEVETWNPDGESLVWVRVPELKKGTKLFVDATSSSRQNKVENSSQRGGDTASTGVWQGYAGVWHFAETAGIAKDSAAGRDAVPAGGSGTNAMVAAEGPSGRARVLSGKEAAFFTVENSEQLKLGGRFAFSGWIRGDRLNPFKLVRLVSRSTDKWGWTGGGGWGLALNNAESLQIDGSKNRVFATVPNCADGAWHHLCVSFDGTNVAVSADGEPRAIARGRIETAGDPEARLQFGWRAATPANPITLRGAVDEFRLKTEPVSTAWAKAEYDSLANPRFVVAKGDAKSPNLLNPSDSSNPNAANLRGASRSATGEERDKPPVSVARGASDAPETRPCWLKLAASPSNPNAANLRGASRSATGERCDVLPVIPRVTSWKPSDGQVRVGRVVKGDGVEAQSVAKLLTDDLSLVDATASSRQNKEVNSSSSRGGDAASTGEIRLSVDPKVSANPEGYRLVIAPSGVTIVGATRTGLYWGTRTLLQLLDASVLQAPSPAAPSRVFTLACGVIDDAPKYRRRGFMLDVGRKYFPLAYLKDIAKTMAYYKMNDFHLHLNDNGGKEIADDWKDIYAAFRMECETYPGLTAKDGSYGKAEFRQFIKDAAKIGVQIVPEFDAPAHSLAFTRYRPDFEKKDHDPAHIELKNPEVIPFFEKLWAEYLGGDDPVFAGPVVHVGSDEYWAKEAELFRTFLDHMLGTVQSYGKTPRAWGSLEHCRGKTPVRSKGVELDIWYNPYYGPAAALRAGYEIIAIEDNLLYICPACGYYNDYLPLRQIYRYWEPTYIGNDEVEEGHPQLLGGAFAVWNDHIGNGISCDDVTDRVFPALQTMSEKMWHGTDRSLSFEEFEKRADKMSEAPGVNLRDRVKTNADGTVDLASATAIGWTQQGGWTVSFDLTVDGKESKDTVLFDDGMSQVCLNLGGTGRFGFRRDGYDCTFTDPLPTGTLAVKMTGDAKGTSLFLGGKLVERLQKPMRVVTKKGYKIAQVETLHFPLVCGKAADGKVSNLSAKLGTK